MYVHTQAATREAAVQHFDLRPSTYREQRPEVLRTVKDLVRRRFLSQIHVLMLDIIGRKRVRRAQSIRGRVARIEVYSNLSQEPPREEGPEFRETAGEQVGRPKSKSSLFDMQYLYMLTSARSSSRRKERLQNPSLHLQARLHVPDRVVTRRVSYKGKQRRKLAGVGRRDAKRHL